jgi:hypothetical protein
MINAAVITDYHDEDGQVSQWQIAEGNGHYYLFDMAIGELVQELPGVRMMSDPVADASRPETTEQEGR